MLVLNGGMRRVTHIALGHHISSVCLSVCLSLILYSSNVIGLSFVSIIYIYISWTVIIHD